MKEYVDVSEAEKKTIMEEKKANGEETTTSFTSTGAKIIEKTNKDDTENNFVKILCNTKYKGLKSSFTNWSKYIMEELDSFNSTQGMSDLFSYLMYKATGDDKKFNSQYKLLQRTLAKAAVGSLPIMVDKSTFYLSKKDFVNALKVYQCSDPTEGAFFARSFQANAEYIYDTCIDAGINPILCVAQGVQESGWGTSKIAQDKNNFWGLGASDTGDGAYANAFSYANFQEAVKTGYLNSISRYTEGGSKYSIMEEYVSLFQPYRAEITINSIYAMTAVYAPIYGMSHATEYDGGVYKDRVIYECCIKQGYLSECNHDLNQSITAEEAAAYAVFYGDKINKLASQIWGEKAFVPDTVVETSDSNDSGSSEYSAPTGTFNGFDASDYSMTEQEASQVKQMIQLGRQIISAPGSGYSNDIRYGPTYDCSSYVITLYRNVLGTTIFASDDNTDGILAKFRGTKYLKTFSFNELKPGDILFHCKGGGERFNHVALYIGNGYYIHAANPNKGILMESFGPGYSYRWDYAIRALDYVNGK